MAIFKIWSKGINPTNKKIFYRSEYVDTKKNELFNPSDSASMVKVKYTRFWNLDPNENVMVEKIKRVNVKSKGENWGIRISKKKLKGIV